MRSPGILNPALRAGIVYIKGRDAQTPGQRLGGAKCLWSGRDFDLIPGQLRQRQRRQQLSLNACEINCFKSGAFVARICFYKEGKVLPAQHAQQRSALYLFPLSQFGDIIDILRYEKPLGLYVDSDSHVGALGTGQEPVGERRARSTRSVNHSAVWVPCCQNSQTILQGISASSSNE